MVTAPRKALSSHPKHHDWPTEAVDAMRGFLERNGEHAVYESAQTKLNQRVTALTAQGVDVKAEIALLQALRSRVKKLCLTEEYLERYRLMIHGEGYQQHQSNNKVKYYQSNRSHSHPLLLYPSYIILMLILIPSNTNHIPITTTPPRH